MKKLVSIVLVLTVLTMILGGCSPTGVTSPGETDKPTSAPQTTGSPQETSIGEEDGVLENKMPITSEPVTMTMYMKFQNGIEQLVQDFNESPTVQEIEKRTGIHIEFITPPASDDGTFFSILLASNEFPDIFIAEDEFWDYPGGADGAVEDKIIINHNELVEKYAYNYMELKNSLDESESIRMKTDNGMWKLTGIGSNVVDGKMHTGLVVRKDWLDELELSVPRTIEEFENMLIVFRDEKGATVPLALEEGIYGYYITSGNILSNTYGTPSRGFMLDEDGDVTHSYLQPGYKDFLEMIARWMKEGLIDNDMINRPKEDGKKMMYSGQAGVTAVGNWSTVEMLELGKIEDPNFDLVGISAPRLNDPEEHLSFGSIMHRIGGGGDGQFFISTSCENPEMAIKWIDDRFSEEGNLLTTFGVGDLGDGNTTYEIVEGEYEYSDYLKNHPDYPFATIRSVHYIQQLCTVTLDSMELSQYDQDIHQQCWEAWSYKLDDSRLVPSAVSMTSDESRLVNEIMTEIDTYISESVYKIIAGEETIDVWDSYVDKIYELGIEEAISAQQTALERYHAR